MKILINTAKTSGLAVAMIVWGVSARADEPSVPAKIHTESAVVEYADLDLSHAAGIDALYSRVRIAASDVCAPRPDFRDLRMRRDWTSCFDAAVDYAVASVDRPALAELHFLETGRRVDRERLASRESQVVW